MILSSHPDYIPKDGCSCGAEDALFDFIPDTIYGLNITKACCVHDDRYTRGGNIFDKDNADKEFLSNMLSIINSHNKWYYPHWLARRRAMSYYDAVVRCGKSSFNFNDMEAINV